MIRLVACCALFWVAIAGVAFSAAAETNKAIIAADDAYTRLGRFAVDLPADVETGNVSFTFGVELEYLRHIEKECETSGQIDPVTADGVVAQYRQTGMKLFAEFATAGIDASVLADWLRDFDGAATELQNYLAPLSLSACTYVTNASILGPEARLTKLLVFIDGVYTFDIGSSELLAKQKAEASPAPEQWTLGEVGGAPLAQAVSSEAALIFDCDADDGLVFVFSLPLDAVKGKLALGEPTYLAFSIDGETPKVIDLNPESVGERFVLRFRGNQANAWASLAKRARKSVRIALRPQPGAPPAHAVNFTARGSTAAMKAVEGCVAPAAPVLAAAPPIDADELTKRLAADPLPDQPAGMSGSWLDSRELFGASGNAVSFTNYANYLAPASTTQGREMKQKLVISCTQGKTAVHIETNDTFELADRALVTVRFGEEEPTFQYWQRTSERAVLELPGNAEAIAFTLRMKDHESLTLRVESKTRVDAVYNLGLVSEAVREVAGMCGWEAPEIPCARRPCR